MLVALLTFVASLEQVPPRLELTTAKQEVASERPQGRVQRPHGDTTRLEAVGQQSVARASGPIDSGRQEHGDGQPEEGWMHHHLTTDPVATFTALLFVATVLLGGPRGSWFKVRRGLRSAS